MNDRIFQLEQQIKSNSQKYYEGFAEISDEAFDSLVDELRELDPNNSLLNKVGWGYVIESSPGEKANHYYQVVGSLNKVKSPGLIPDNIVNDKFMISAKLDGISCVCYYTRGKLSKAITRGNGITGIDVTDKLLELGFREISMDFTGAIRGELVISNKDWLKIQNSNLNIKNQRNGVAGIINRIELSDELKYVTFVPYNIVGSTNSENCRSAQFIRDILSVAFIGKDIVPVIRNVSKDELTQESLEDMYKYLSRDYPTDGLVITSDNVDYYDLKSNEYGYDEGAVVYHQVAYKFSAESKISTIRDIQWNMTRTNKLVPIAIIDPVELSGATVSRVTAFNANYIVDNDIGVGAEVLVMRSGEVIPSIVEVVKPISDTNIPTKCPVCGSDLVWDKTFTNLVCVNKDCGNKEYSDLQVWSSIIGKVDGLGDKIKFKSFEENCIYSIDDLYSIPYKKISGRDNTATGNKLDIFYDKLRVDEIDPIDALVSLNVPRLGRTTAKKIIDNKVDISNLYNHESFVKFVESVRSIVGNATANSISNNENKFTRLHYINIQIDMNYLSSESNSIKDMKKIAITGKLSMKRSDLEKLAEENGYISGGITKDTVYLVTNTPNSSSSKNKKADELGIKKVTEEEFMSIISN